MEPFVCSEFTLREFTREAAAEHVKRAAERSQGSAELIYLDRTDEVSSVARVTCSLETSELYLEWEQLYVDDLSGLLYEFKSPGGSQLSEVLPVDTDEEVRVVEASRLELSLIELLTDNFNIPIVCLLENEVYGYSVIIDIRGELMIDRVFRGRCAKAGVSPFLTRVNARRVLVED